MGEKFEKFVESGTDAQYIKFGTKCPLCSKKLSFFETGFWSCNAEWLADAPVCKHCAEKLREYLKNKEQWMTPAQMKEKQWRSCTEFNWGKMTVEKANALLNLKEYNENEQLDKYSGASSLFRVKEAFQIYPEILDVGIARAKLLKAKITVFGITDAGEFKKGDIVTIERKTNGGRITAQILEAYIMDCEENDINVELKAKMGKQCVPEGKEGWLVLNIEDGVSENDIIIK